MRSNPVPAREEWDPIQAEESLTAAFMDTALSGRWILRFRDTTAKEISTGIGRAAVRDKHGEGGISGWEVNMHSILLHHNEGYTRGPSTGPFACTSSGAGGGGVIISSTAVVIRP